jgi:hypothetical protein
VPPSTCVGLGQAAIKKVKIAKEKIMILVFMENSFSNKISKIFKKQSKYMSP